MLFKAYDVQANAAMPLASRALSSGNESSSQGGDSNAISLSLESCTISVATRAVPFTLSAFHIENYAPLIFPFLECRDLAKISRVNLGNHRQVQSLDAPFSVVNPLMQRLHNSSDTKAVNFQILERQFNIRLGVAQQAGELTDKKVIQAFLEALYEVAMAYSRTDFLEINSESYGLERNQILSDSLLKEIVALSKEFSMKEIEHLAQAARNPRGNNFVRYSGMAAGAGNAFALLHIGTAYLQGALNLPQSQEKAVEYLKKAANAGCAKAQCLLADAFNGNEAPWKLEVNNKEALYWYQKSAALGNAKANYKLAMAYQIGYFNLEIDILKAVEYYTKSAQQGEAEAWCRLGEIYQFSENPHILRSESKALDFYERALAAGSASAKGALAHAHEYGLLGFEKDPDTALRLYLESAAEGSSEAQNSVAQIYQQGRLGVAQDLKKALDYYRQAVAAGNASAMDNLGYSLYYKLFDTPTSEEEIRGLFEKAASIGCGPAKQKLAIFYENGGLGIVPDPQMAARLKQEAENLK